jgi:hypothetical protein
MFHCRTDVNVTSIGIFSGSRIRATAYNKYTPFTLHSMAELIADVPCTVRDDADCGACEIRPALHCRWDKNILKSFIAVACPTFVATLIILVLIWILTGQWWPVAAYFLLVSAYFGYEIRFLCSHCPFYAGGGRTLRCLGNNGAPKVWAYSPAPMTGGEKLLMLGLVATFYIIVPSIAGIVLLWLAWSGGMGSFALAATAGVFIMALCGSAVFFQIMKTFYCSMCVNFSCPLNTVEKRVVDDYLSKNDAMREAWEESGYRPG